MMSIRTKRRLRINESPIATLNWLLSRLFSVSPKRCSVVFVKYPIEYVVEGWSFDHVVNGCMNELQCANCASVGVGLQCGLCYLQLIVVR